MDELSIKVVIGGRTYPLTIRREEEEIIRRAAKNINESIENLQQNYAVKDMQDLLAMTCLQVATKKQADAPDPDYEGIREELSEVDSKLDQYLSE